MRSEKCPATYIQHYESRREFHYPKNFLCSSWLFFPRLHPLIFLLENFNLSGVLFCRFLCGQSFPEPRARLLWPANPSGPPDSGPTQCWGNKYVHHHAQLFAMSAGCRSSFLFNTCSHSVSHFPSPWSLSQGHCSYLTDIQLYVLIYLSHLFKGYMPQ